MTKKITDNDTKKVADLIKIKLAQEELPKITKQLDTVLDSMDVLGELDTKNIEPTAQTHGLKNVLREDKATPGLNMENYKNRENFDGNYFIVKKVL